MALSNNHHRGNRGWIFFLGAALAGLALGSPAAAAPATKEGAKAITDGISRLFGKKLIDKGMITVKPNGDHYDFTYDLSSSKMGLPADGPQFQAGPFTVQVTLNDSNTVSFTFKQPSLDFSYKSGKTGPRVDMVQQLKNCSGDGLVDIKAMALVNQKTNCDSGVVTMHTPLEDIDATLGKINFVSNGKVAANGDVDFNMTGDLYDMVEKVAVKDPANPAPPMAMRSDRIHEEFSFAGLRNAQLTEALSAFAISKPGEGGKSGQSEAMAKLKAVLPLWQNVTAQIRYDNLTVGTPGGIIKIGSLDTNMAASGAVKNGSLASTLSMSGLELPDGLLPDWAKALVPANASVNLKLAGVDLDAMAGKVIDDFGAPKGAAQPDALKNALLAILMSSNPQLTFDQSLTAPAYDVKGQGQTTLVPNQQGKATVSSSNLDGVISTLGNAGVSTPSVQQGMMGLAFLKGLAKAGPDGRLTWDVEFDNAAKTVIVNGQAFGPGAQK